MFHLVYRSLSKGYLEQAQIDKILAVSQVNNKAKNVTGILLYRDKVFLQLLEGDKDLVMHLYQHIALDPRHTNAEIVLAVESNGPLFKDWNMGHIKQEHLNSNSLSNIAPFLEVAADHGKIDRGLILALLKKFVSPEHWDSLGSPEN